MRFWIGLLLLGLLLVESIAVIVMGSLMPFDSMEHLRASARVFALGWAGVGGVVGFALLLVCRSDGAESEFVFEVGESLVRCPLCHLGFADVDTTRHWCPQCHNVWYVKGPSAK